MTVIAQDAHLTAGAWAACGEMCFFGFAASDVRLCHFADFRESSVMIYELLNIPSQSLSTEVILVVGI